jgi:mRNA-degrading endonuclease RelE of RelBE toxin-antitoxin system
MMYALKFTPMAVKDLTWLRLTSTEIDALEAKLSALCKLHNVWVDSAVCKVAQTHGEWGRVKITKPAQLRAFFTVDEGRGWLVIRLVLRRAENTYNQAEIVWKAEKQRVA